MSTYSFGSGYLFGTRTDIATQTPQIFGTLQDVSVEFSATDKQLFGQSQYPVLVARGQAKIACKAKMGSISANMFNSLFFGGTLATGSTAIAIAESGTLATSAITVSNAANFVADEGVFYIAGASAGLPMVKVASGATPTVGQYKVAAGVYTFSSTDQTAQTALGAVPMVSISYTYSVAATGQKLTLTNPQVGSNPVFSAALYTQANTPSGLKTAVLNLRACVASKLSMATKIEDFTIPELDFSAFADSTNTVFDWSFNEVS